MDLVVELWYSIIYWFMIKAPKFQTLPPSDHHRGFMGHVKPVHRVFILLFTLFCIVNAGSCATSKEKDSVKCDACGPYNENFKVHYDDDFAADVNAQILSGNSVAQLSLENVCSNSNLFCFPSTLPGFLSEEKIADSVDLKDSKLYFDDTLSIASAHGNGNATWASSFDSFKLLNGRVVSCSLNSLVGAHDGSCHQSNLFDQDDITSCRGTLLDRRSPGIENSAKIKSDFSDGGSLQVEINPPMLDWGEQYLYKPSLAFLTVTNTHSDKNLNVYEPYSTSSQFYPCNFSEMTLEPGEAASVCVVFLPKNLGMSSAQFILQTSFGGFLVQARGFANESPYGLEPMLDLDDSSGRKLRKNLSFFNPFEETLYVEEVIAWISYNIGSTSHLAQAICRINSLQDHAEISDPSVQKWVGKKLSQVDMPGVVMRPHRKWEIAPQSTEIIVDLDFQHSQGKIFGALCMQVLRSSVEKADIIMVPLEAEVSITSTYTDLTNPISVSLDALLPCDDSGTVFAALSLRYDVPYLLKVVKISAFGENAQSLQVKYVEGLIIFPGTVTQIKVPCSDIIHICSSHSSDYFPEDVRTDSDIQSRSLVKALEMAQADELVLLNWRSQGSSEDMSVLEEHEVLFPMVEIGTHHSQWITLKNPSHLPVVMQLILNSGEVIDECRDSNGILQHSVVHNKDITPKRYGFSIADSAVTEAYVHPYGRATFGPILFQPSSRCWWRSSALIRNNLSGVEWLSLQGFGGSLSLALFEGSDPVHRIEFDFNIPLSLNRSSPDMLNTKNNSTCPQPYVKEFYAKNTGDLLVEVSKIEISGARCELDGFLVHTCKGFALQPNESKKLVISHETDFSAAIIQRDLQLTLPTGILVIPMKASLPMSMLNVCKKSLLRMRVKRSWLLVIFASSLMFILISRICPQVLSFYPQSLLFSGRKCSIAPISHQGEFSFWHCNRRESNKFTLPATLSGFLRFSREALVSESGARCSEGQFIEPELEKTDGVNLVSSNLSQKRCLVNPRKETTLRLSSLSKSVALENSAMQDVSEPEKLTVRVGKDKGKRRRKKKSSTAGLTGQPEFSSSQSGNSTPSSPLSPVISFNSRKSCSKSPDVDPSPEVRSPFTNVRPKKNPCMEKSLKLNMLDPIGSVKYGNNSSSSNSIVKSPTPSPTPRRIAKPVLLPSATFPSTGKSSPSMFSAPPFLASTSPIAPHARAPGPKFGDQRSVGTQSEKTSDDKFKYDIWGDHLFGLQRMDKSGEVYTKSRFATKSESRFASSSESGFASESDSNSFFVRGPQIILPNPQVVGSYKKG
ncbi:hypothetical protein POM88_039390 [Heracleum sosnowskyi]|uniref:Transmembrane protein 131-like N-terminal domain-containing protein n=1 Tax=Heracleum sosnowskyi TaxID=360622 RepID=A0AAD8M8P5_9APIA|nr:hypothetical protein POM88_039390 [Heracleum sosnowskyi]